MIAVPLCKKRMFVLITILLASGLSNISEGANATGVTQFQADGLIARLEKNITSLKSQGIYIARFEDVLIDIRSSYDDKDYNNVMDLYTDTLALIDTRSYLNDLINRLTLLMDEANRRGLNVTDGLYSFNIGQNEFENTNFESAKSNLEESYELVLGVVANESTELIENLDNLTQKFSDNNASHLVNDLMLKIQDARVQEDFATIFFLANDLEKIKKSLEGLETLKDNIVILQEQEYGTSRLEDAAIDLEDLFSREAYDDFLVEYNTTLNMINKIYFLDEKINETWNVIRSPEFEGIPFAETELYLNLSRSEFFVENYEKSEEYLSTALSLLDETEQEYMFSAVMNKAKLKFNYVSYLRRNWWKLLITAFVLVTVSLQLSHIIKLNWLKMKLTSLKQEQKAIVQLLETLQIDYFKNKTVDKSSYTADYKDHEARRGEIVEQVPLIEAKIQKMSGGFREVLQSYFHKISKSRQEEKIDKKEIRKKDQSLERESKPHANKQV